MAKQRQKPASLRSDRPRDAGAAPPSNAAPSGRLAAIDTLRGFAIAMMFAYHFCFDLSFFRVIQQDFYNDARWIAWRTVILSSFLLLVGIGLALAHTANWSWPRYGRRLAQIAGCAALVSIGSYSVFPESWIYFGVLHHIALASILALPLLGVPRLAMALGVALIALGALVRHPFFDAPPWHWFGLMTFKPRTEDYVPLLPWFGVVLLGVGLGHYLAQPAFRRRLAAWRASNALTRALAWGGRHSLLLYMLHQPIFIGALMLIAGAPKL